MLKTRRSAKLLWRVGIGHTFRDASYLPAPVVSSCIMSTAKHVRRVPNGRGNEVEVKKVRRNKGGRREEEASACRLPRRRAATVAARNGLNVMSFVTTRPSRGECCHPEGVGDYNGGNLLIPRASCWNLLQVACLTRAFFCLNVVRRLWRRDAKAGSAFTFKKNFGKHLVRQKHIKIKQKRKNQTKIDLCDSKLSPQII